MAALAPPWPGIVALSGGSDSLALMLLLKAWALAGDRPLPSVAVVDHGLRPESAQEARQAAKLARAHGLKAAVLTREGAAPAADIEAFAREARYRLLGAQAQRLRQAAVYVAHTEDDQAETFLLRLARGSGVDGLGAMKPMAPFPVPGCDGLVLVRPLLAFSRRELRDYLAAHGQSWIDDPMNEDSRFARVRVREAWPFLETLGLGRSRLAATAARLARARAALEAAADDLATRCLRRHGDDVLLDADCLAAAPEEIGLRVLADTLMMLSGRTYRPRLERLERLYRAICGGALGGGCTLHDCRIATAPRKIATGGGRLVRLRRESGRRRENVRQ